MHREHAGLQGETGVHVEPNSSEAHAANTVGTVLLLRPERNRGAGRFICTGVRWAESTSRKNNRGIYEKLGATKDKNIILANDNDEKRMLLKTVV